MRQGPVTRKVFPFDDVFMIYSCPVCNRGEDTIQHFSVFVSVFTKRRMYVDGKICKVLSNWSTMDISRTLIWLVDLQCPDDVVQTCCIYLQTSCTYTQTMTKYICISCSNINIIRPISVFSIVPIKECCSWLCVNGGVTSTYVTVVLNAIGCDHNHEFEGVIYEFAHVMPISISFRSCDPISTNGIRACIRNVFLPY